MYIKFFNFFLLYYNLKNHGFVYFYTSVLTIKIFWKSKSEVTCVEYMGQYYKTNTLEILIYEELPKRFETLNIARE